MATTQAAVTAPLSFRVFRQVLLAVVFLCALLVAIVGQSSGAATAGTSPMQVSAVTHGPAPAAPSGTAVSFR
jgi:hypothetical protein